jgi:hypothetical protein
MTLLEIAQWLENSPLGQSIRESALLFPNIESLHVLAITCVVGTIAVIDLRLLDAASRSQSVSRLTAQILPFTWAAFALAAATGGLLFISRATSYIANVPFQFKMALLIAAGFNMLLFHLVTYRSVENWDANVPTPPAARIAGALSLLLWMSIVGFGRWIGFV